MIHGEKVGGRGARVERRPQITGRRLRPTAYHYRRDGITRQIVQRPGRSVDRHGEGKGGAQRSSQRCGLLRLIGMAQINSRTITALDRAEAAVQTTEALSAHLPMMKSAGEQTEQDAGEQHPCSQRTVSTGKVHGQDSSSKSLGENSDTPRSIAASLKLGRRMHGYG